jgi:hypothetical protein
MYAKAHQLWGWSSFTTSHQYIYESRNAPSGPSSDSRKLQEVAWIPKSKTKIGHLRWLRQQLPSTIDDDVITTVTNITISLLHCVLIDTTLPRRRRTYVCTQTAHSWKSDQEQELIERLIGNLR